MGKPILFLIILISIVFNINAQNIAEERPDKIRGIAREDRSLDYYNKQAKRWHERVKADTKDAEAWHYYYLSERSALQLAKPK